MKEQLITLAQEKGFMSKDRIVSTEELPFYLWMCELQKWLRDKHKVKIYISPWAEIWKGEVKPYDIVLSSCIEPSYEKALECCIFNALQQFV